MVMRMLGEMAVASPSTGSFADWARRALGGWAGFSVGWLYWYFWVIVVGFEAVAGGEDHHLLGWMRRCGCCPSGVMLLMTATNLASVRVVRRVRILVRRHQGVLRSWRSWCWERSMCWGIWPNKELGLLQSQLARGPVPGLGPGAIYTPASWLSSFRWSAPRSLPSRRPNQRIRRARSRIEDGVAVVGHRRSCDSTRSPLSPDPHDCDRAAERLTSRSRKLVS